MTIATRLQRLRTSATAILAILALGMSVCNGAHALPTLSLSPSTGTIAPGGTFTLDLMASGVDQGIGGWSLGLTVADAAVATLTGISFSGALGAIGSEAIGFGDAPAGGFASAAGPQRFDFGVVSLLSAVDMQALQGASFRLATLSFNTLSSGTAQFGLVAPANAAALSDAAGNALAAASLDGATVIVSSPLSPFVSPVPEPSTAALLAAGLACLGVARRVRRGRRPG